MSELTSKEKTTEVHGDKSDDWVAGNVRMLNRTSVDHEAICVAARDRIKRLAQRVAELEAHCEDVEQAAMQANSVNGALLRDIEDLKGDLEEARDKLEKGPAHEPGTDPNPLDPTNQHFRICLRGHVAYSASFDECPSCKVERGAGQPPGALQSRIDFAIRELTEADMMYPGDDWCRTSVLAVLRGQVSPTGDVIDQPNNLKTGQPNNLDIVSEIYSLLVRRGFAQWEAQSIANGPGCRCTEQGFPDRDCYRHGEPAVYVPGSQSDATTFPHVKDAKVGPCECCMCKTKLGPHDWQPAPIDPERDEPVDICANCGETRATATKGESL